MLRQPSSRWRVTFSRHSGLNLLGSAFLELDFPFKMAIKLENLIESGPRSACQGAFRFECYAYPGHYLAFFPPTHLRVVGGQVEDTTAIDFMYLDCLI